MGQSNLSSEDELLLYCSRLSISDDIKHKIDEIFRRELDWSIISKNSKRQGISPLFYRNLKKISHDKDVPPEVIKDLEEKYYKNIERNILLYDELGKVLKVFNEVGIETIVLKGAFLAEKIYKNIGLRAMSDIDLLIKKEDLQKAKKELEKMRYFTTPMIFPSRLHEKLQTVLYNELPPFVHETKRNVIEIHWDIQPPQSQYKVEINEFWNNTKLVTIAGIEVLTFAPEDTIQHLCLHLDKHINYSGAPPAKPLRDYCDIAEVTKYQKETINWHRLVESSKNFRTEKPVAQSLFIAKKYFDAFVPENILNELGIIEPKNDFDEYFKEVINDNSRKESQCWEVNYLKTLKPINGTCNKVRLLIRDIFPTKEYMMYRYSIKNEKQVYKYYLIHSSTAFQWGLTILWKLPHYLRKSS